MDQLVLFGVGVLAILSTWHWMYQPSLLDQTRDKLFDLRDEVRAHFVANGYSLDDRPYRAIRDLLNGHLLHTNRLSFSHFVAIAAWMQSNQKEAGLLREKLDRLFKTDDTALAEYLRKVRKQAALIMLEYMIKKSPAAILFACVGAIVVVGGAIRQRCLRFLSGMNGSTFAFARMAAWVGSFLVLTPILGLGNRATAQEAMEECALHQHV